MSYQPLDAVNMANQKAVDSAMSEMARTGSVLMAARSGGLAAFGQQGDTTLYDADGIPVASDTYYIPGQSVPGETPLAP